MELTSELEEVPSGAEESEETPSSLLLLEQGQENFSTRPDVELAQAKEVLLQLLCEPGRPPSGPRALS